MILRQSGFLTVLLLAQTAKSEPDFYFTCDDLVDSLSECGNLVSKEGTFVHHGLSVKYWVYKDTESSNPDMDPVITIHGGPGAGSGYLQPLKQLACRGRTVVRYDQAGCGQSEHVKNVSVDAPWLLELSYYPQEFLALVDHLGFKNYHAFGHSWGTIVGQELAMLKPKGMSSLALGGALSNMTFYIDSQRQVRHTTLTPYLQKLLKQYEQNGDYTSPLYAKLNDYLGGLWTSRTVPSPDCVAEMDGFCEEIYLYFNGPSEFTTSDTLKDWSVTGKVDGSLYPTLVIGGEHDTMTEQCLHQVADNIHGAELEIVPLAGHMTMIDNPEVTLDNLQDFMTKHDHLTKKKSMR